MHVQDEYPGGQGCSENIRIIILKFKKHLNHDVKSKCAIRPNYKVSFVFKKKPRVIYIILIFFLHNYVLFS